MGNPISIRFDSSIPEPARHIFANTLFKNLNQDMPKINANIKTRIRDAIVKTEVEHALRPHSLSCSK